MTHQTCSVLLAFLLFAGTAWPQTAQPIDARKPSDNPPEVWAPIYGCRFHDSTYCDVFGERPRSRINIPRRHQMESFGTASGCRRRRVLIGVLAGAGIGATIGAVGSTRYNSRGNNAASGAALFGLMGWVVGSATGCH